MKKLLMMLIIATSLASEAVLAVDNISVDKIEIYIEKSKIPYLEGGGASIPAGVKVAVLRTNNTTYANWKFVAYGESLDQVLSVWLAARALNKNVSCHHEDRGNYWVQCVGVSF